MTLFIYLAIYWGIADIATFAIRYYNMKKVGSLKDCFKALLVTPLVIPILPILLPFAIISTYRDQHKKNKAEKRETKQKGDYKLFLLLHKKQIRKQMNASPDSVSPMVTVAKNFLSSLPDNSLDRILSLNYSENNEDDSYSYLLKTLSCLKLKPGCKLEIRFAGCHGIGDHSSYYVRKSGSEEKYRDIFHYIDVEWSEMGIWQAYILDRSWHELPVYWHGGYDVWSFTFDFDSVYNIRKNIMELEHYSKRGLDNMNLEKKLNNLFPIVMIADDKRAYVRSYHWQRFGGLVREDVLVERDDKGCISITNLYNKTIHAYGPGFLY